MDNALLKQIHKYAVDRSIDWTAATVIGEQHGIEWKSEGQLKEFKLVVDTYLKTFDLDNFELIEAKIAELSGKTVGDSEGFAHFADPALQSGKGAVAKGKKKVSGKGAGVDGPKGKKPLSKVKGKKKKIAEGNGITVFRNEEGNYDIVKDHKRINCFKNITESQVLSKMGLKKKINESFAEDTAKELLSQFMKDCNDEMKKIFIRDSDVSMRKFSSLAQRYVRKHTNLRASSADYAGQTLGGYGYKNYAMSEWDD